MQIHYEKHPVSPERKAELRGQGLKIIDERFKPEGAIELVEITPDDIATMPKAEVIEHLAAHGIEDAKGKVDDPRALLTATVFTSL